MKARSKGREITYCVLAVIGFTMSVIFLAAIVDELISYSRGDFRYSPILYRYSDEIEDHVWLKECRGWHEQGEYIPWEEVSRSWYSNGEIRYSNRKCPGCGTHYRIIGYVSPDWTWKEGIGREGELTVCPVCHRQESFRLTNYNL